MYGLVAHFPVNSSTTSLTLKPEWAGAHISSTSSDPLGYQWENEFAGRYSKIIRFSLRDSMTERGVEITCKSLLFPVIFFWRSRSISFYQIMPFFTYESILFHSSLSHLLLNSLSKMYSGIMRLNLIWSWLILLAILNVWTLDLAKYDFHPRTLGRRIFHYWVYLVVQLLLSYTVVHSRGERIYLSGHSWVTYTVSVSSFIALPGE